jgi:hypothetical protein
VQHVCFFVTCRGRLHCDGEAYHPGRGEGQGHACSGWHTSFPFYRGPVIVLTPSLSLPLNKAGDRWLDLVRSSSREVRSVKLRGVRGVVVVMSDARFRFPSPCSRRGLCSWFTHHTSVLVYPIRRACLACPPIGEAHTRTQCCCAAHSCVKPAPRCSAATVPGARSLFSRSLSGSSCPSAHACL